MKLAAPMISRARQTRSAFNEGISVPQAAWDEIAKRKPDLNSKDAQERSEAVKREVLKGELAQYRRR